MLAKSAAIHKESSRTTLNDKETKTSNELGCAICNAAGKGNSKELILLLEFKDDVKRVIKDCPLYFSWAIYNASYYGHHEALSTLLNKLSTHGVLNIIIEKYSEQLSLAIKYAAERGHIEVLNLLLNSPGVVDKVTDEYPKNLKEAIKYAIVIGQHKTLELIFKNDKIKKKVRDIASTGYNKVLELLINNKNIFSRVTKNFPNKLSEVIQDAIKKENLEALKLLPSKKNIINTVIKNYPDYLDETVKIAVRKNNIEVLELLLTREILKKLHDQSPKTFYNIEKYLSNLVKDKNANPEVKIIAVKALDTINGLKKEKNFKEMIEIAGAMAVPAGVAIITMAGFVGLVKTSRSNKIKNCSLVTNYLVPAFNKINNKFTKIFPKHDLNKLAQALTNPKIERLIVKMIAILGVIVSIGAGLVTYRKQGGTILGM